MAKKPLVRSNVQPYHVVNRLNNRERFTLPMEKCWEIFAHEAYSIQVVTSARIYAFVLMSNHYHMDLLTPLANVDKVMQYFGRFTTQTFNLESGRSGHLFEGRYKPTLIESPYHSANVLKYIYRNPVKAGIVKRVEDYPYSSLNGILGRSALPFPVHPLPPEVKAILPQSTEEMLAWLNRPFKKEQLEAIQKGLRKRVFELPRQISNQRKSPLDFELG